MDNDGNLDLVLTWSDSSHTYAEIVDLDNPGQEGTKFTIQGQPAVFDISKDSV